MYFAFLAYFNTVFIKNDNTLVVFDMLEYLRWCIFDLILIEERMIVVKGLL